MGFGVWGLGFGVWGLGFGVWGLGFGVWGLGFGVWGLGFGVWGLGFRVIGCQVRWFRVHDTFSGLRETLDPLGKAVECAEMLLLTMFNYPIAMATPMPQIKNHKPYEARNPTKIRGFTGHTARHDDLTDRPRPLRYLQNLNPKP